MKGKVGGRTLRSSAPVSKLHPEDENNKQPSQEESNEEVGEEIKDLRDLGEEKGAEVKKSTMKPGPKSRRVEFDVSNAETVEKPKKPKTLPYVLVPPLRSHEKVKPVAIENVIPMIEKKSPAYKHQAPIEKEVDMDEVIQTIKDQRVEITQGQIMGVANSQFRKKFVDEYIPKRIPTTNSNRKVTMVEELEEPNFEEEIELDDEEEVLGEPKTSENNTMRMEELPRMQYRQLQVGCDGLPAGAIVLGDPYEQYLSSLGPGEKPKRLIVARESQSLKSVYPLINGKAKAETLLDSGSQIISMSLATAERLSLTWDPDVIINMESANKQVESTKGLARNVPFAFGEMILYLQVHIINDPAYDVLLGKPFEVLTESNVKTKRDGTVELTLTDPNNGKKLVITTYDRGKVPSTQKREPEGSDFQSSMI